MKNALILPLTLLTTLLCFSVTNSLSDPSYGLLNEEIDFEDIFSEIPLVFDFEGAAVSNFSELPFFSDDIAQTIINFRKTLGTDKFLSEHLDEIPGISPIQLAVLNYLVPVSESPFLSELSYRFRSGIIHRPENETLGESKYYFKLNVDTEKGTNITFIGERDAFEPRAIDHFSGNISFKSDNGGIHIVLGDYRPGFGQGLVFSRYGRSYGNGTDILVRESKKTANTFFEESLFLRGGSIAIRKKWFKTYLWASSRNLDATITENGKAVTIRKSGYHFSGDIRGNLKENIAATRIAFGPGGGFECGLTGTTSQYSPSLDKRKGESYLYAHQGSIFNHVSFDGKIQKNKMVLFFEHAQMNFAENATIVGILVKGQMVRTSVLARRYSPGYWAHRSGGYSSFGKTSNEKGIYSAVQIDFPGALRLVASMDIARTLYRTYSAKMPSSRERLSIMIQKPLKRHLIWRFNARSTEDIDNRERRWNCSVRLQNKVGRNDLLRWRLSLAWSERANKGGPFTETNIRFKSSSFTIDLAAGLFDIPSYDSRYYRYEYNVPGRGMSLPVWGRGGTVLTIIKWGPFSGRYLYKKSDLMGKTSFSTLQYDLSY